MGRSVVNAGKSRWVASSNARIAAYNETLLEKLTDAAISVLHHDTTEGSDVDKHERASLRKRFARVLKIKLPDAYG